MIPVVAGVIANVAQVTGRAERAQFDARALDAALEPLAFVVDVAVERFARHRIEHTKMVKRRILVVDGIVGSSSSSSNNNNDYKKKTSHR